MAERAWAVRAQDEACSSLALALMHHGGFHALQLQRVAHALWASGDATAALRIQARMHAPSMPCRLPSSDPWNHRYAGQLLRQHQIWGRACRAACALLGVPYMHLPLRKPCMHKRFFACGADRHTSLL